MERAEEINEEREAVPEDASEFATRAAANGMFEVEAGKLAQQQATSTDVKNFAGQIVNDHTAANDELKQLASSLNIALPQSITEDQREKLNDLREKQGVEFDKEYMDMMVSDHKDSVGNFEDAAEDAESADLKNWAAQKVSVLREHHQMAEQLKDKVKDLK
jgi:putative membrane protein